MKNQPKLTPWFNIETDGNPARKGWYAVQYNKALLEAHDKKYWDGKAWRYGKNEVKSLFGNIKADIKYENWRGLASDPKVKK